MNQLSDKNVNNVNNAPNPLQFQNINQIPHQYQGGDNQINSTQINQYQGDLNLNNQQTQFNYNGVYQPVYRNNFSMNKQPVYNQYQLNNLQTGGVQTQQTFQYPQQQGMYGQPTVMQINPGIIYDQQKGIHAIKNVQYPQQGATSGPQYVQYGNQIPQNGEFIDQRGGQYNQHQAINVQQPNYQNHTVNQNNSQLILKHDIMYPRMSIDLSFIILIINIFIPGMGTMIMACCSKYFCTWMWIGLAQLFLSGLIIGWVWSIMTGIMAVKVASSYKNSNGVQNKTQVVIVL
jgi:hypothetical protein